MEFTFMLPGESELGTGYIYNVWTNFNALLSQFFIKHSESEQNVEASSILSLLGGKRAIEKVVGSGDVTSCDDEKVSKILQSISQECLPKFLVVYERHKLFTCNQKADECACHFLSRLSDQCKLCAMEEQSSVLFSLPVVERLLHPDLQKCSCTTEQHLLSSVISRYVQSAAFYSETLDDGLINMLRVDLPSLSLDDVHAIKKRISLPSGQDSPSAWNRLSDKTKEVGPVIDAEETEGFVVQSCNQEFSNIKNSFLCENSYADGVKVTKVRDVFKEKCDHSSDLPLGGDKKQNLMDTDDHERGDCIEKHSPCFRSRNHILQRTGKKNKRLNIDRSLKTEPYYTCSFNLRSKLTSQVSQGSPRIAVMKKPGEVTGNTLGQRLRSRTNEIFTRSKRHTLLHLAKSQKQRKVISKPPEASVGLRLRETVENNKTDFGGRDNDKHSKTPPKKMTQRKNKVPKRTVRREKIRQIQHYGRADVKSPSVRAKPGPKPKPPPQGEGILPCDSCHKYFRRDWFLQCHKILNHSSPDTVQCTLCSADRFPTNAELLAHVKFQHKNGNLRHTCRICEKSFSVRSQLREHHRAEHLGQVEFSCATCPKKFKSAKVFQRHSAQCKLNSQISYPCPACGLSFNTRQKLERHERSTHTGEKPYQCTKCSCRFAMKCDLTAHMKVHNEERKRCFQCHVCGKTFYERHYLPRHMLQHQGIKNFSCQICGDLFTTNYGLKKHCWRKHDQPRPPTRKPPKDEEKPAASQTSRVKIHSSQPSLCLSDKTSDLQQLDYQQVSDSQRCLENSQSQQLHPLDKIFAANSSDNQACQVAVVQDYPSGPFWHESSGSFPKTAIVQETCQFSDTLYESSSMSTYHASHTPYTTSYINQPGNTYQTSAESCETAIVARQQVPDTFQVEIIQQLPEPILHETLYAPNPDLQLTQEPHNCVINQTLSIHQSLNTDEGEKTTAPHTHLEQSNYATHTS